MGVHVESDAMSSVGRAAHDISLAALLGGNLFARVAMHPALSLVSSPRERGRVVNEAWQRYGVVNSLALAACSPVGCPRGSVRLGTVCCPIVSRPSHVARMLSCVR